jgi:hypothetical protein
VSINSMGVSIQPDAMMLLTFGLLGLDGANGTSPASSVSPVGGSGLSPFGPFQGEIFEGTTKLGLATGLELSLERNRSLDGVIGTDVSPDVFEGLARGSGTLTAFFQNLTYLSKFVNETESSLFLRGQDPATAGTFLNFVLPRVKYTGGDLDPGQQGGVPLVLPFRALKKDAVAVPGGTTRNTMMSIQRSYAL